MRCRIRWAAPGILSGHGLASQSQPSLGQEPLIWVVTRSSCSGEVLPYLRRALKGCLWSRHCGNVYVGTDVDKVLDESQRVLLFLLGLIVEMGKCCNFAGVVG
jgi:hypothetical protein